jgi:two-component system NtrC family sensor kinase
VKTEELPPKVGKDLKKIINASLHAREIVKKLSAFARQKPTQKVSVDVNEIVREWLSMYEDLYAAEKVRVISSLSMDLPMIVADRVQMHQVLTNLCVNALQAMPDGGTITIRTVGRGRDVCLVVEDTGIGMSPEVAKEVFTPFFTTKAAGEGTGLGLAVVSTIVSSHGGTIKVAARSGEGARFEVYFPASLTGNAED